MDAELNRIQTTRNCRLSLVRFSFEETSVTKQDQDAKISQGKNSRIKNLDLLLMDIRAFVA